jgi:GcrA cell cycle regulator
MRGCVGALFKQGIDINEIFITNRRGIRARRLRDCQGTEWTRLGSLHHRWARGAPAEHGDDGMLWTEETIEILKRLALEGRSASLIAVTLGAASRNAVIGKASRIGIRLNGDGRGGARRSAPVGAYRPPSGSVPRPKPAPGEGSSAQALSYDSREERKAASSDQAEVGEMRRVRFEDIRQSECRWPLGDPKNEDFAYCGLMPAEGRSYCGGHCRMAYRPPNSGAREWQKRRWSRIPAFSP